MIPEDHKHLIIQSGIDFIRSITLAYGADEGMKLWDTIANTLDPDVKGQILFAMLTGAQTASIVLRAVDPTRLNKIGAIKEVRSADPSLGLKEAKDVVEAVEAGRIMRITVDPHRRGSIMRALGDVGVYC